MHSLKGFYQLICFGIIAHIMLLPGQGRAHNNLTLRFTAMTPHVGQKLEVRVVDKGTRKEVGRTSLDAIPGADFDVNLPEVLEIGASYWIDFYADLNQNGIYDSPPVDHAWRLNLDNVAGDTTLTFVHNTNFTDIDWVYALTINISNMNPHQGQLFELRVVDVGSGEEIGRMRYLSLAFIDFTVQIAGTRIGHSYYVDFYADLNQDGRYDSPPADHAWRLQATNVAGDDTLNFSHNTNFTDINWVDAVTLRLTNMNPHVGQKFEARVIDLFDRREVGRASVDAIAVPDFSVEIPGIIQGHTYYIDFYADLNQNGVYDSPPMDHAWREQFTSKGHDTVTFNHNTNFTDIDWKYNFILKLENMNPHIGQKFEARVIDLGSMKEVGRASLDAIVVPDFQVNIPGIEPGKTYWVDFYADLNQNGLYDDPPADHVWREQFTSQGDAMVMFSHNTNFTATGWKYLLSLKLSNMTPHLSQKFEARVIDVATMEEVGRESLDAILVPDFAVHIPGLEPGSLYWVDFYADLNQNGLYDDPPVDHVWREEVTSQGDAIVMFNHNTNFTATGWEYKFMLKLQGMTPHLGQKFEARVIDLATMKEIGRKSLDAILVPDFQVCISGVQPGRKYWVDFYADLNQNGLYDMPPADHAWREEFSAGGDAMVMFMHNTSFTDIDWPYQFILNLTNMNPHVGQKFEMRVVEDESGKEVARKKLDSIIVPNFQVAVAGIKPGKEYHVDFYADLNQNGLYDVPPTDHAWRERFSSNGDTQVDFNHNTSFVDIDWVYMFTLHLKAMNPHLGQLFEMRVVDENSGDEVGRTRLESILVPDFSVFVPGIRQGGSYRADFYADFNQNGQYDSPPTDHAWREAFTAPNGDASVEFTHNTNFTDIQWPPTTGIKRDETAAVPREFALRQNYPNPFNPETTIEFDLPQAANVTLEIFNTMGQRVNILIDRLLTPGTYRAVWDGRDLAGRPMASGLYFYRLSSKDFTALRRMVLMK